MKRLLPIGLLFLVGCAHSARPVTCPPPPVQTTVITSPQVNKRYQPLAFAPAPASFVICGTLPPGLSVTSVNGQLWLGGTPSKEGKYVWWIAQ